MRGGCIYTGCYVALAGLEVALTNANWLARCYSQQAIVCGDTLDPDCAKLGDVCVCVFSVA